ncbi:MAG: DUF4931 domain-containing protein [Gammaproteobacteria bacterium]|nr:DUF4931 domain-containing protein [Gammaproteobacteria bacterium]
MSDNEKTTREIRIDPIVPTSSVLVATARGMRPRKEEAPAPRDTRKHVDTCPFCRGNEDKTPPTIASYPEEKQWDIRVVANLYPVLGENGSQDNMNFGLQQTIEGYGRHEVIIDHPSHGIAIHEMSTEHLAMIFKCYQDRMRELYTSDERLKYILAFKNFGPAAGASIPHTHSQIIAMPVVPENLFNELENSHQYFEKHHKCVFCSLIDEALTYEATIYDRESGEVRRKINVGQYVIEKNEHFVAIKPFASRYEWEIHILPLEHQADYLLTNEEKLQSFAEVLKNSMARLDQVIGGAQYNYFLHSIPHSKEFNNCSKSYHWHLEICPRTSIPSGFELGSGLFVNTISPEDAAEKLRSVDLSDIL